MYERGKQYDGSNYFVNTTPASVKVETWKSSELDEMDKAVIEEVRKRKLSQIGQKEQEKEDKDFDKYSQYYQSAPSQPDLTNPPENQPAKIRKVEDVGLLASWAPVEQEEQKEEEKEEEEEEEKEEDANEEGENESENQKDYETAYRELMEKVQQQEEEEKFKKLEEEEKNYEDAASSSSEDEAPSHTIAERKVEYDLPPTRPESDEPVQFKKKSTNQRNLRKK